MREIGGRIDFAAFSGLSARFALGFFSSIKETDSTCGRGVGGSTTFAAADAAAAASAAARDFAAGVGATAVLRGAALPGAADFPAPFFGAGSLATADFTVVLRAVVAGLRVAAVFVVVVLVGM
jgi:hypothetical protein